MAAYRARFLAARAAAAKGDLKQAETFLLDNLNGEHLTPASKEWRESLFLLGEQLHSQGRYAEAIRRLDEAVARYPRAPQAIEARYLIADAATRSAMVTRAGLKKATDLSAVLRAEREAEGRRLLQRALDEYRGLESSLSGSKELESSPLEAAILRNCRFAVGNVLFRLNRPEEAIRASSAAANAYPDRPEVLDAYVQLANVYRSQHRTAEARTAIAQAKVALGRLPKDAPFEKTTNFGRQQWASVLDWMCSL